MRNLFLFMAILGIAYWYTRTPVPSAKLRQDYQRGLASGQDYCTNKKFCVLAYVAPWCPACKQISPKLKEALEKSPKMKDYGFKVVVGQGKPSENDAEAASYGFGAVTDPDNILKVTLGVDHYPYFFVLDQDSSVVLRDQEAFQWAAEKFF
jgi:thiol-disulfide isomerase/thioredoxin